MFIFITKKHKFSIDFCITQCISNQGYFNKLFNYLYYFFATKILVNTFSNKQLPVKIDLNFLILLEVKSKCIMEFSQYPFCLGTNFVKKIFVWQGRKEELVVHLITHKFTSVAAGILGILGGDYEKK